MAADKSQKKNKSEVIAEGGWNHNFKNREVELYSEETS